MVSMYSRGKRDRGPSKFAFMLTWTTEIVLISIEPSLGAQAVPAYDIFQLSKDGKVLVASDYKASALIQGELPGRVFVYTSLASGVLTRGRSDDDGLGAPRSAVSECGK